MRRIGAFSAVVALNAATPALPQPIDRHALVSRHDVVLTAVDPHVPLMLGNGSLGFTADITGLQTFPEQYSPLAPLLTMAQWAWHSFPNPKGYDEAAGLVNVPVPGRGDQLYPWIRDWDELKTRPELVWLRENPHRFSLGRIALALRKRDGSPAAFADIGATRQRLDLWTGTLTSSFIFDGQQVSVETRVAADSDAVLVVVRSPLVSSGRVGVDVRYPGVSTQLNPDPSDFANDQAHSTTIVSRAPDLWRLDHKIDDTVYHSAIAAPDASISQAGPHRFELRARGITTLIAMVSFDRTSPTVTVPNLRREITAVTALWHDYWMRGGMVDFSGSTDPRAAELERRVILSQYLSVINEAGEFPPQEEGLFSNSWNGKFHLEVHPIHAAHFAPWGRPDLLERSLAWYLADLPRARAEAARHGIEGAWWTKMSGPEGRNSPSTVNPFIMWQQPAPIYMAELVWRTRRDRATLDRYAELVDQTARLLASWPRRDGRRFTLGPPIIPVQENHPPLTTDNPAYELEFFRWGLETAQQWRARRGLSRKAAWDAVIAGLPSPAERNGLYLPVASEPDFWRDSRSPQCSGHAVATQCLNRDHPSMLMAFGIIPGTVDREAMRRTLRAVEQHWDLRQTWGWDFPVIAMTAARLGEPGDAVDWLMRDLPNNHWGVSGMTPRVHVEAESQLIGPAGAGSGGNDGPGLRRAAETYFPSNGALLLAVGMMAAGWDGSTGQAPGFPKDGWKVRVEGIKPLP